jgi:hypothetical protein
VGEKGDGESFYTKLTSKKECYFDFYDGIIKVRGTSLRLM